MRDLVAAAVDLGWAASLYGAERLFSRPSAQGSPADEMAEMARALRSRLGPLARALCRAGEDWRREGFENGFESAAGLDVLVPGSAGALARQELRNRLEVYRRVVESRDLDGLDLEARLARIEALETHRRLWAYEGLGYRLAADALDREPSPRNLLRGDLPAVARPMLHAGMGLAFAEATLADLGPSTSVRRVVLALDRFLELCRRNARDDQEVGAWDSLGFFVRHQRPEILGAVGEAVARVEEERALEGFFWHGVGRALYFLPLCFLPGFVEGSRALDRVVREVEPGSRRRRALAGLAVAATLTNLRHPAVLEALVASLGDDPERSTGFTEGVESALLMRRLMPDAVAVETLLEHRPDDEQAAAWCRLVRAPAERASGERAADEPVSGDELEIGPFLALNRRLVAAGVER